MTSRRIVRTAPVTPGAVPREATWIFRERTERAGEHLIWTGTADKGTTPVLYVGTTRYPARRVAWLLHHGTSPTGLVKAECGTPLCMHGPRLSDEASRQADHVLYAAVVHGITLTGTCRHGHDRARWGYVQPNGKTGCRSCDNARRRTTTAEKGTTA